MSGRPSVTGRKCRLRTSSGSGRRRLAALPALVLGLSICGARGWPAAVEGGEAPDEVDLGIPSAPPWEDPLLQDGEPVPEGGGRARRHPLEVRFWERLSEDSEALERWRKGLLEALRFARGRPQVFPPAAVERASLFEEYRAEARGAWNRAMDYWLALDALLARYGAFGVLADGAERKAAFLVGYAAYLAQARFVREWTELGVRDPNLGRLFDEPVGGLGLPAGSYTLLERRFLGPEASDAADAVRAYHRFIGGSRALEKGVGRGLRSWRRERELDAKFLPRGSGRRPMPPDAALALVRDGAFAGTFALRSAAGPWDGSVKAPYEPRRNLLLPLPVWEGISVSSRVVYALDTLRYWFQMDAPSGPRPDVLISREQAREVAGALVPGDILLVRRERYLSAIGQPGFWHHAALYAGTADERRRYFKGDAVNERLRASHSEAYRRNAEEGEDGAPCLLEASERAGGVVLTPLSRVAAADALAVLRPRLGLREKARALERAFRAFGKPYDYQFDFLSDEAVASAELIYRAYAPDDEGRGLRPPGERVYGRRSVSPNMLARTFDAVFGTADQRLDWVLFLDGRGDRHDARAATMEEFRRSWRRPKWALSPGKENDR
ncbi:MAG: YiiX/YebB-like N1pC/P60 family cysteine hydrolase [Elusimicrobiota bacterium]